MMVKEPSCGGTPAFTISVPSASRTSTSYTPPASGAPSVQAMVFAHPEGQVADGAGDVIAGKVTSCRPVAVQVCPFADTESVTTSPAPGATGPAYHSLDAS